MGYSASQDASGYAQAVAASHAEHAEINVRQTILTIAAAMGLFFTILLLGCAFAPTIPLIG
ncbi:hypothetical protein AA103196_0157 [Ameyamaea chiangmaiensis NBRC 103196]|uniref:Uncharacterized protein n=1 Tax=Ameyamaea chiangmaiensis TaxID=442969 RepID=A0A850PLI7_9PROT|nr:hypothetical protein [Ameyamaea chiangmaiensis]MBS4076431.1 hypothetical protein [Ameyamaea chiangmaiensis]NVN42201.1 hypothetical protein [Ameyamaea chiangmaiensis]GBQ61858.1 hypothetical protein AA103196_0157 [Ameyamaea chiangmaiensis NBRC 103196]